MEAKSVNQPFPNTRWTIIARAKEDDTRLAQKALAELCEIYWPPLYAFARTKGNSPHDAEDLTQSFFARLLSRDDIARADASKGKFRTYLLTAAKNFMISEWKKGQTQKRGGGKATLSLDLDEAEAGFQPIEPSDTLTADKLYDRQWAMTQVKRAQEKLANHYAEEGKFELFKALEPSLVPHGKLPSHAEVAAKLGMNESAVGVAIHRLRKRYGVALREIVADTLGPEDDLDEEMQYLLGTFS